MRIKLEKKVGKILEVCLEAKKLVIEFFLFSD